MHKGVICMVKSDVSGVIVNTDYLAKMFGVTRRYVNQLAKEGVLERRAPGRWPLETNVIKYIEFLRSGKSDPEGQESKSIYWEERAKHEAAKREMAELNLAKLKNQMHDAADVEMVMTNMLTVFRNRILGIPQKLAPKLISMNNLAEISSIIETELMEALSELKDYDPTLFMVEDGGDEQDDDSDENGEAVQQDS